jgi:protease IV
MIDRRALIGILIFGGLILACFGFALLLLRFSDESGSEDGPRIGVVQVKGVISDTSKGLEDLRKFRKDESIKAIVVRIDTPGGAVGPAQEMYREIERTRGKKPVVASLGAVAASGGYYIAAACDRIVASSGTITGSIGVISQTVHVQELLDLARIQTHTFKSGPFKDVGSPLRAMGEEDKTFMQGVVLEIYHQFLRDVAKGRKLPEEKVKPVADGRVLSGEQALASRLVDRIGNFSDALDLAAELAKAKGDPVPVYPRSRRGVIAELLSEGLESMTRTARDAIAGESTRVEARDPTLR